MIRCLPNQSWRRLILIVSIALTSNCLAAHGQAIQTVDSNSDTYPELNQRQRETANRLIMELADSKFSIRQRANDQLWEMGPAVIPLLETQLDSSSVEASTRAKKLVALVRHNIGPDSPVELAELVIHFTESEYAVQEQILQRVIEMDRLWLALDLVESIESELEKKDLFKSAFSIERQTKEFILSNRTEDLERLLAHDVVRQFAPEVPMYYLWQQGRLDDYVARLKTRLVDDPESFTLKDRLRLVGLLRFKRQYDEAIQYAEDIDELGLRYRLIHVMLMESGNWSAIADMLAVDESENEADESNYFASPHAKALIYFYADDREKLEDVIAKLELAIVEKRTLIKEEKKKDDDESDGRYYHLLQLEAELEEQQNRIASLYMYLLDWERAKKHITLKRDQTSLKICLAVNRYELLFETMGIDGDFKKRKRAFDRRLRKIKSLFVEADRTREKERGGWEEESEELDEKRSTEIELYILLAEQIAQLGFEEEAEYYLRQLFYETADQPIIDKRTNIINALVDFGSNATVWELADQFANETNEFQLFEILFPGYTRQQNPSHKKIMAQKLSEILVKKYPDIEQRLRKIAQFVKSPLRIESEEFDFHEEIQVVRRSATNDSSSAFLMFDLCTLHPDKVGPDEANFWLEKSADNPRAQYSKDRLALLHYRKSEFVEAAELYELLGRTEDSCTYWAEAARAYRKAGNEQKALEMDLMMAMGFEEAQLGSLYEEFFYKNIKWKFSKWFQLKTCLASGDLSTNRFMISESALAADSKVRDVAEASNQSRLRRLHDMDSRTYDTDYWAEYGIRDMGYRVRAVIEEDNFDEAIELLQPLSVFSPADPSLAEFAMPMLQQKGASKQADEMFTTLSGGFFETLKQFPNSTLLNNNYAWMCACAKRKLEFVERHAKRAVERRPNSAGYLDTLAEVYFAQGDFDQAIATIKKSIELVPTREYYHEQLARFKEAKRTQQK